MKREVDCWRLSNNVVIDPARFDRAVIDLLADRARTITDRLAKDIAITDLRDTATYFADAVHARKRR